MSCNAVHEHKIWFTNGSSTKIQEGCQNLLIPVEKINKQNPSGQTTATIGVPFTYRLTIPVLFDPATGTVINFSGSPNDLHGITVWDDLNATGADLSYVSHVAYWLDDGTPVPHTFSNENGFLTFDDIPIVAAGRQFVIELTVVLNDTPANVPGTQFVNTPSGSSDGSSTTCSTSRCRASGASRRR
jgi:large repetitive protein